MRSVNFPSAPQIADTLLYLEEALGYGNRIKVDPLLFSLEEEGAAARTVVARVRYILAGAPEAMSFKLALWYVRGAREFVVASAQDVGGEHGRH